MINRRKSNIELLRIIAMCMVVVVHLDGASLGLPEPRMEWGAAQWWQTLVETLAIVGVNCFTLISGYFGIRPTLKGGVKFTLMCMFYAVGLYILSCFYSGAQISAVKFLEACMVYTHTDLWYVPAYLGLYLLSPWLNQITQSSLDRRYRLVLVSIFVIWNIWGGWFWHMQFNPTGYTLIQLIMMYLVGQCISAFQYDEGRPSRRVANAALLSFAVSSLVTMVLARNCEPNMVYAYNSPFVIAASISLFVFFLNIQIESKFINRLAAASFAVYLIHKNPLVWGGIIKPLSQSIWHDGDDLMAYSIFIVIFTAAIYLATYAIDSLRLILFREIETLFFKTNKILKHLLYKRI